MTAADGSRVIAADVPAPDLVLSAVTGVTFTTYTTTDNSTWSDNLMISCR